MNSREMSKGKGKKSLGEREGRRWKDMNKKGEIYTREMKGDIEIWKAQRKKEERNEGVKERGRRT